MSHTPVLSVLVLDSKPNASDKSLLGTAYNSPSIELVRVAGRGPAPADASVPAATEHPLVSAARRAHGDFLLFAGSLGANGVAVTAAADALVLESDADRAAVRTVLPSADGVILRREVVLNRAVDFPGSGLPEAHLYFAWLLACEQATALSMAQNDELARGGWPTAEIPARIASLRARLAVVLELAKDRLLLEATFLQHIDGVYAPQSWAKVSQRHREAWVAEHAALLEDLFVENEFEGASALQASLIGLLRSRRYASVAAFMDGIQVARHAGTIVSVSEDEGSLRFTLDVELTAAAAEPTNPSVVRRLPEKGSLMARLRRKSLEKAVSNSHPSMEVVFARRGEGVTRTVVAVPLPAPEGTGAGVRRYEAILTPDLVNQLGGTIDISTQAGKEALDRWRHRSAAGSANAPGLGFYTTKHGNASLDLPLH